ncbi:bifunctional glycosyltransferase/CDP-glycerol:glycerophosphate glycerophosphotransferase [Streptomyces lancefieldiae]|uniref:Bifunctional glycosyltransferase family 2 protein/CDP-glycerol:glycerophosphate glycerophosphotransferase n=1 Tax=Streptomyces lancefieldiae TaxID=3075520 RepID=A0ABU3AMB7_9ACTN|nr:bifunctional glycosyltransferase family 2 protein/CDP-glycerol:glycerophosphate glycerophosphotransferase [Streptomyces sp. DSM 40712]MDT0611099.1 bifunctional glycosyltransferase family 2 protein/CDP-glycerol:glycerophosphate glycerophosphotransferase [Streptomyces sp. DSM 40712]
MPRFSVVIPVFKVEGYLRECLDSVLEQSFRDIELIVVNDCSPDSCGAIIDEYAARDERVKAVHLPENVGLGRARNTGLERARGDYVLFLDSDDSYLPGLLQALAARLDAVGDLDILAFDHVRTHWWGRGDRSKAADLIERAGTDVFRLKDRPEYLRLFLVAWNKAFRREFFLEQGFQYAPGLYEDAPVTFMAMVTAERIGCLNRVGVAYRQRRQGAITKTPGRKHFDIFTQYEGLFAFLAERPELVWAQSLLFERAVYHMLFALKRPERVRVADRREFFDRTSDFYAEHLPAGFTLPEGSTGVYMRALAKRSYRAYQATELAERVTKAGPSKVLKARTKVGKRAYAGMYTVQRRGSLDPNLAVYTSYWDRLPSCNPLAVFDKAKELAPEVHGVWVVREELADQVPDGIDHVLRDSRRYWEVMARARYFVNNVNFPDSIVKRPGQFHLQTHHGTPLKRMGIDQRGFPAAARGMDFDRLLARVDRWDLSVSSNQHSTRQWKRAYPGTYETLHAGYPRNDRYYRSSAEDVAAIRARLGIAPGKTALLYAPTHRDYRTDWTPSFDLARLAKALGDDFVLLVRTHYLYGRNPELSDLAEQGAVIDVSRHPVVEDLCLAADALIADYSSLTFDYANLDRPVVIYADDWKVYSQVRGVTFDLLSGRPGDTPGSVATTEDELVDTFRSGRWRGPEAATLRAAFRERFCQYDDGHAAERVVRRFFLGQDAEPATVPLAQRTPAPKPSLR